MISLQKSLLMVAMSACNDGLDLSSSQMKDIFKLAIAAARQTQRINGTLSQEVWQSEPWHSLHKHLLASARFNSSLGLQKMCKQLTSFLQVPGSPTKTPAMIDLSTSGPHKRKAVDSLGEKTKGSQAKKIKRREKPKSVS